MRFSLISFTLLSSVVASSCAFSLSSRQEGLPTCAALCLTNGPRGSCKETDDACLCSNEAFVTATTACIQKQCAGAQLQAAVSAAQALCLAAGVTLAVPSGLATVSGAGSAAATSPAVTSTGSAAPAASTTAKASGALYNGASILAGIASLALAAGNI
ncbi:uncharacterized protein LACBIDRAFT_294421 [Laccaria bicolor S238N-H82]|uniref:Predicted protein n=1 Tax=Laccaria bicolor (strain S238N-H82 / ATCC MYA-4686) TaxID=486041 RepID=B0DAY0_LACBS|nr:uncharacterized protein LACBIDRAFT_294421 [Laccaria bicolor S238N-H82]EDR08109.1 predicted protein [Laccaria bicolor S238N-H82]|eukprot:XP_001881179.1 predicted protein [Laccaria bicolor S238N-H82]